MTTPVEENIEDFRKSVKALFELEGIDNKSLINLITNNFEFYTAIHASQVREAEREKMMRLAILAFGMSQLEREPNLSEFAKQLEALV